MHKRTTLRRACPSALPTGKLKRMTAHGEGYVKRLSDTGSIPVGSTTSKHRLTSAVCYCKQHAGQRASPFSQKSFVSQNIFGSPNNIWCPRCVFHTPKSTKKRLRIGYNSESFSMISVPCETDDILLYDICFAYDIRYAYKEERISYHICLQIYHTALPYIISRQRYTI